MKLGWRVGLENLEKYCINNEICAIKVCIDEAFQLLSDIQKEHPLNRMDKNYWETQEEISLLAQMLGQLKDVQYSLEAAKMVIMQLINKHEAYYELLPSLKNREDGTEF